MNKIMTQNRWWKDWSALGLIFGGGLVIFNAFFGRFPIYLVVTFWPLLTIPVGAALEIIFWAILAIIIGLLVERCRAACRGAPSWHRGAQLSFLLILEAYLATILIEVMMRRGLFRFFPPPPLRDGWLVWEMPVIAAGAAVLVVLSYRRRSLESQSRDGRNLGLVALVFSAVWAVVYNRAMASTQLPLPLTSGLVLLRPHGIGLVAVALGAVLIWFIAKRGRWTVSRLARQVVIAAAAAAAALTIYYGYPARNAGPHIIVSLWDAARSGRMSVYGYRRPTTPFLEKLSSRALLFDQAYAPSNYTLPSHAVFFLGLSYRAHGYHLGDGADVLRYREEFTLPDRLLQFGYRPVLFSENSWVLAVDKGFSEVRFFEKMGMEAELWLGGRCKIGSRVTFRCYVNRFPGRMLLDWLSYSRDGFYAFTLDRIQLRAVAETLLRSRRTGPVFLFQNIMNVHDRYHPYCEWQPEQLVEYYDFAAEYNSSMSYTDKRFQETYRLVESLGELPKTVFIVTSDHGQFLGEFKLFGHHKGLFEPVIRVPLMIIHPALAPSRVAEPVSLDRFFDLVEAIASGQSRLDSNDLAAILITPEPVVAEHGYLEDEHSEEFRWSYTVVDRDWQFVYDPELVRHGSSWPPDKNVFLFDLNADPAREKDVSGRYPDTVKRMKGIYEEYLRRLPSERRARYQPGLKEDLEKQLRSVGYLR